MAFTLQEIGAINCMMKKPTDGKLMGYNVDYLGAITAIENKLQGLLSGVYAEKKIFNGK